MAESLPIRANLQWLKKLCKDRAAALRATGAAGKLSDVQLAVARAYGFASWRELHAEVERRERGVASLVAPDAVVGEDPASIAPDDVGVRALLDAVRAGDHPAAGSILSRRPALARAKGPSGETALHVAAECDDQRLGVFLLAHGADAKALLGESGHTPLSWAVTCNAFGFAGMLVRAGVKPDLFCAAGIGAMEHVRGFFDERGTLRSGASTTGSTRLDTSGKRLPCPPPDAASQLADALYIAARNAQAEAVRFLLDAGADVRFTAYYGASALHWAHFGGSREVIAMLEAAGADPAARDITLGCAPRGFGICVPASWGFEWLVKQRLAQDPTLANFMDGRTSPLHEAARAGHAGVVRLLLAAGADAQSPDGQGRTALALAKERGHDAVCQLLAGPG